MKLNSMQWVMRVFAGMLVWSISPAHSVTISIDPVAKAQVFYGWGTSLCWWANLEGSGYPAFRNKIADILTR